MGQMKNAVDSEQMRRLEKSFLALESFPWGGIYRLVIGFLAPVAASFLLGDEGSGWALVPFLVGALLTLRVVPALFRKMMPFSDAAREVWAERRQMAKRYDSYQWRKLFWIGVGLALYTTLSGKLYLPRGGCFRTGEMESSSSPGSGGDPHETEERISMTAASD